MRLFILLLIMTVIKAQSPGLGGQITPHSLIHSHNDYRGDHPLTDALKHHARSIEADIHLVGNELYVAHTIIGIRFGRTLERLYLKPLRRHINKMGNKVYNDGSQLIFLIDIKTSPQPTYRKLKFLLHKYKDIIEIFGSDKQEFKPVKIVISGNLPKQYMQQESVRYAAMDGRAHDLHSSYCTDLIPIISEKWSRLFDWRGEGDMPAAEKRKLHHFIKIAHQSGRLVRFWGTPEYPLNQRNAIWKELLNAGVDLINTNDIQDLKTFLIRHYYSADIPRYSKIE
ncbi:MAG: hypothetical protein GF313_01030 [Caldithrix sp.]|nr:hypothetical protein [Caldithrix sp.]